MTLPSSLSAHSARAAGRRQAARTRMDLIGRVILNRGDEPCFLDDLSPTGASLTIARNAPPIGDHTVLIVDRIEATGAVIWRHGTHFGLQFDDPVAHDDVLRLRAVQAQFTASEIQRHRRAAGKGQVP